MQSELRRDRNLISVQKSSTAKHEALSENEELVSSIGASATKISTLDSTEAGNSLREITQESQTNIGQRIRKRKPSSVTWHLILILGDAILFVALLGLLWELVPFIHFLPQISDSTFAINEPKLIWMFLALASWSLAINLTQSQNLNYASNRFKSLCSTLFALMLMDIFWIALSCLLLSISFITLIRLELFFLALAMSVFAIWRILLAEVMNLARFRPRAVIAGINPTTATIVKEIQCAKHPLANILGYISESVEERSYQSTLPILGGRNVLRVLARDNKIDMIIIAPDCNTDPELFREAIESAQLSISVVPMAVVYESSTGKTPMEYVGDQWYAVLQSERNLSPLYLCWKKALDLICGLCGLVVLCLVLPVITLLIYLDSPGPIFYSQERVGLRGKPFRIYKFRSMHVNAESEGHAIWATEHDKRVTRVGHFLRATHLDELPQLFNILRGDMSLIGPRPERAEFVTELEKTVPFYHYRLAVKPGLTGWAQVKYHYARTDNDAVIKLQYDLYYIKWRSFMLDLFIVLKTVSEVMSLRGT